MRNDPEMLFRIYHNIKKSHKNDPVLVEVPVVHEPHLLYFLSLFY